MNSPMNPLVLAGSAGLPDGISLLSVFAVIIPVAIVTVLLRQIPFAAVRLLKGQPFDGVAGHDHARGCDGRAGDVHPLWFP